jgi:hypothetical protein
MRRVNVAVIAAVVLIVAGLGVTSVYAAVAAVEAMTTIPGGEKVERLLD